MGEREVKLLGIKV